MPSGAHMQWLAAVEYRHILETLPDESRQRLAAGTHQPLTEVAWRQLELRLLLEALFGRDMRTTTPDTYAGKVRGPPSPKWAVSGGPG